MRSNNYILLFTLAMTTLVALVLSGLFYSTKPMADKNEAVFNKRAILAAVSGNLDSELDELSDEEVLNIFDTQIEQIVLDMNGNEIDTLVAEKVDMGKERKKPEPDRVLPLYIFKSDKESLYIVSVRGNGLWDEIWGNIALKSDFNTIAGVSFDHKQETPGLGAEIKDNPSFPSQFKEKKLYDGQVYKSVTVRKGGARDEIYEVDGIAGATVTSDGVSEMLYRGIQYYEPYFKKLKSKKS